MKLELQREPADALTEASFLILIAIANRPMHGYLIMQTVDAFFGSESRIGAGTLYRTLQRLSAGALIEAGRVDPSESDDERRIPYRITRAGRTAIRAELHRLHSLIEFAATNGAEL